MAKEDITKRNIAKTQDIIGHSDCEECSNDYMFLMKDNYHAFFVPVDEIFVAMQLASNKGVIPPIPEKWLYEMSVAGYTVFEDSYKQAIDS